MSEEKMLLQEIELLDRRILAGYARERLYFGVALLMWAWATLATLAAVIW